MWLDQALSASCWGSISVRQHYAGRPTGRAWPAENEGISLPRYVTQGLRETDWQPTVGQLEDTLFSQKMNGD
jgi:hypothetical protein